MTSRRTCPNCGRRRALSKFSPAPAKKKLPAAIRDGCDDCRQRHIADCNMWARYRIRLEDYERMAEEQDHCCASCGDELDGNGVGERFHIDHCHDSGAVRGLLCQRCNLAVGQLKDDPVRALKVAQYLVTGLVG